MLCTTITMATNTAPTAMVSATAHRTRSRGIELAYRLAADKGGYTLFTRTHLVCPTQTEYTILWLFFNGNGAIAGTKMDDGWTTDAHVCWPNGSRLCIGLASRQRRISILVAFGQHGV